jgi:rod shape-determining protein MreC
MLELLRKYRTPLLAGCLVLAALLFYSAHLRQRETANVFERIVLGLTAPMQRGMDAFTDGVTGVWGRFQGGVGNTQEVVRLAAENRLLRAELEQLAEVRLENERLSRMLDFREAADIQARALPARVIAEDASSWFRTIMIDRGSKDGVAEGQPVVVAEGVVGRVIKTAHRQSRVLLITDASSAVAGLVQRTRTRGVCRGQGDQLSFDFAMHREAIEEGDRIVTSGMGGVFPKGLSVGTVRRVKRSEFGLFHGVEVTPAVDFYRLEEVLVLLKENQ